MSEENLTPAAAPDTQPEKTFTQAEVDAMIGRRLAQVTKGMPKEEELAAFRAWRKDQQTEQERVDALTRERDSARGRITALESELEQLKRMEYVRSKGLSGDDAEFLAFKAAKMVDEKTTFEAAVDTLAKEKKPSFDWTAPLESKRDAVSDSMNAWIRGAFK